MLVPQSLNTMNQIIFILIYQKNEVIGSAVYYRYWQLKNKERLLIGHSEVEIIEEYEILSMDDRNLILLKKK
jgi:hypothetical protein